MAYTVIPSIVDGDAATDDFPQATKIAVEELQAQVQETYTSWTPTFTGLTTTSGTLTGRYYKAGKLVTVEFQFVFGASSAVTGDVIVTNLPYQPLTTGYVTTAALVDTGTATHTGSLGLVGSSSSMLVRRQVVSGSNIVVSLLSSTTPFTWTTGDIIQVRATYITAS